ncbi:Dot/Icm type IV secretion system effector LegD1 [soil metagenome]
MLTDAQLRGFRDHGYLVIEDFVPPAARASLRARAIELGEAWEPGEQRSVFTTDTQQRTSNTEFLGSGSTIWCFFEADAVGPDGSLRRSKELSINKIGHAQHDLDPVFERFTYTPALAEVTHDIGLLDPLVLQSMYIFKQPGIGGEVGCHQDASFLYTDPISVTGFWFAIEDATIDNGCLWVAPGGHHTGLRSQFRRSGADPSSGADLTRFEVLDPTPLPTPPDELVPLEVPAGTLVVLDGLLPHWSDVNRSPVSRHAYTVHCISASAEYPEWNWLQRPDALPLRRLDMVAA